MTISANYLKVEPEDVDSIARTYAPAWQEPHLPQAQYDQCVKEELEAFKAGKPNASYDTFINLLKFIPAGPKTLLDVGASSGYYSEVLKIRGFQSEYDYTGVDYSPYYKGLALELYPDIKFEVGSATELPFDSKSFDVILHGACIMHIRDYRKAIQEAARVAKTHVLFHRTPVYFDETPTEAFVKTAYGVPCVEFHFNEKDIVGAFYKNGLEIRATADVFLDGNFGHRSYLLAVK